MKHNSFFNRTSFKWVVEKVILSWYSIAWVVLFCLIFLIATDRLSLNSIKAGSLELSFEQKSKDLDVYNTPEFKNVKNLNENELKLFLIMGGDEAKNYIFTNRGLSNQGATDQYLKLQSDSLLRIKRLTDTTTMIFPTDVGSKLHKALIQSIYYQIIK